MRIQGIISVIEKMARLGNDKQTMQENVGSARKYWRAAAFFGIGLLAAILNSTHDVRTGLTVEFVEYADTARAIATGHGFSSRTISPSMLAVAEIENTLAEDGYWPQSYRHPGFAYILSFFFFLFGATDGVLILALSLFFALFVSSSYLIIRRYFGENLALAASILLLCNPVFLRFFIPGGYVAFLFAAVVLLFLSQVEDLMHKREHASARAYGSIGIIAAFAWHLRFNFSLFFVIFLFVSIIILPRNKKTYTHLAISIGVFFLGTLPFRIWQESVFGDYKDPASIWNLLDGLTGYRPWAQYKAWSLGDLLQTERVSYLLSEKFPFFVEQTIRHFPSFLQYIPLVPFFVASLFIATKNNRARTFLLLSLSSFIAMTFVLSFFRHEIWIINEPADLRILSSRYYIWFAPVFLAASITGLLELLKNRSPFETRMAFSIILGIQLFVWLPLFSDSSRLYADIAGPVEKHAGVMAIRNHQKNGGLAPKALLLSNIPSHVSWYANQTTLGIPDRPAEIDSIRKKHALAGLHFTRTSIGEPHNLPEWVRLFQNHEEMTFFLARHQWELVFSDGKDWLFLPSHSARMGAPPPRQRHIGVSSTGLSGAPASPPNKVQLPAKDAGVAPETPRQGE
jgi:hypothetical protein